MKRFLCVSFLVPLTLGVATLSRADEKDGKAIIEKGIASLGGEAKLAKAGTFTSKSKGTVSFNGEDHDVKVEETVQGLDHHRFVFEGEFNGDNVKGMIILKAGKGWRKFGEDNSELDEDGIANAKRTVYLSVVPSNLLALLKGKDFKIEKTGEEKVGDKPAVALKITGPDGKDFKLLLDKETGLPLKLEAKVVGFDGSEYVQETTYSAYKDFDGIKHATKVESKRDGEKFIVQEVSEFKVLDKAPADSFEEPK